VRTLPLKFHSKAGFRKWTDREVRLNVLNRKEYIESRRKGSLLLNHQEQSWLEKPKIESIYCLL
jgi:hypothetical protein